MEAKTKRRLIYFALFVILLGAEIYIGMYVRDSIIRPYGGDVLVVILLYCLIRILFPDGIMLLPLFIFLFSCGIEFAQKYDYATLLGFADNKIIRTILGTSFSWYDILSYGIGCAVLGIAELSKAAKGKRKR